jgi:hypothetical protein
LCRNPGQDAIQKSSNRLFFAGHVASVCSCPLISLVVSASSLPARFIRPSSRRLAERKTSAKPYRLRSRRRGRARPDGSRGHGAETPGRPHPSRFRAVCSAPQTPIFSASSAFVPSRFRTIHSKPLRI